MQTYNTQHAKKQFGQKTLNIDVHEHFHSTHTCTYMP